MTLPTPAIPVALVCLIACGASPAAAAGEDQPGPICAARSIRDAARAASIQPPSIPPASILRPGPLDEAIVPEAQPGWFRRFLWKHRYHLLSVVLAEQADYYYENQVGPPDSPRLFGSTPSLDDALLNRYGADTGEPGFVIQNKSTLMRAIALGAMTFANGRDLEGLADDVVGLVEAHKFNWATSGLVKNLVGRPRPLRDGSLPGSAGRDSFYSDAASKAFTYMAYTDSVMARRLKGRPAARALTAIGLYGLAGAIAWSRVEQGRHYVTDVVAGAGAGFAVGKIFYRVNHAGEEEADEPRVSFRPALVPGGAGLYASIRF